MRVLVTGSKGFIGKNLIASLQQDKRIEILEFTHSDTLQKLEEQLLQADIVYHLAGINRPDDPKEFYEGNSDLTRQIVTLLQKHKRAVPIVLSSSIQVLRDNDYGKSKKEAEEVLQDYSRHNNVPVFIYRLPNVFGKWCRPNYNSVVATWCYNITHGLPMQMNDPSVVLNLVYIDDVVKAFMGHLAWQEQAKGVQYCDVTPVYRQSLENIYTQLLAFEENPKKENLDAFAKALYQTYLSYQEN